MRTDKIKVAFIVHNAATWESLHPVYVRMAEPGSGFLPKVFTIPCDHSSMKGYTGEEETAASLAQLGITAIRPEHRTLGEFLELIKKFAPDYMFRQAPWDSHLPPEFRLDNMNFSRLCYVPYGFMTANIEDAQCNQPFHHACWRIFCETRLHQLLYEKNSPLGSSNVTVTGYPKFESLWKRRDERFWPTEASDGDVKIIWAPHHSLSEKWLGFSTFVENHMQFLELARQNPNLHIVLRPHPGLLPKLSHRTSREALERFLNDFNSLPNAALYEGGDFAPLFGSSDLLITDGISFFSEYMVTGKPIIYTDSGRSVGFNAAGSMLLGGLYRTRSFDEVIARLVDLIAGKDPLRESRLSIAETLFNPAKKFPSELILEVLKSSL